MLACGATVDDAICFANDAAGLVVGKVGTATVSVSEVMEANALAHAHPGRDGALVARATAVEACRRWQAQGLKVGFANGCFDLVHPVISR
jgi:D-beta-D-heptose 7-phosphate kinase/D-beta-D-heptose 1-phosphate adenosyltransferase